MTRKQWKSKIKKACTNAGTYHKSFETAIDTLAGILETVFREVREELGLTDIEPCFILQYVFESEREKELVHVFSTTYNGEIVPSDELDGGRFWSLEEVRATIGKEILTPNFEQEFIRVFGDR